MQELLIVIDEVVRVTILIIAGAMYNSVAAHCCWRHYNMPLLFAVRELQKCLKMGWGTFLVCPFLETEVLAWQLKFEITFIHNTNCILDFRDVDIFQLWHWRHLAVLSTWYNNVRKGFLDDLHLFHNFKVNYHEWDIHLSSLAGSYKAVASFILETYLVAWLPHIIVFLYAYCVYEAQKGRRRWCFTSRTSKLFAVPIEFSFISKLIA